MDPVDQKELKGKFKDREDKDIDNDGDADKSDEYLHNRRKAISKNTKKEGDVKINPTVNGKSSNEQKESRIRQALLSVLESSTKHGADPKTKDSFEKQLATRQGEKDFVDAHEVEKDADGHEDAEKVAMAAKASAKKAPARPGDQATGDKNIVTPSQALKKMREAYESMNKEAE